MESPGNAIAKRLDCGVFRRFRERLQHSNTPPLHHSKSPVAFQALSSRFKAHQRLSNQNFDCSMTPIAPLLPQIKTANGSNANPSPNQPIVRDIPIPLSRSRLRHLCLSPESFSPITPPLQYSNLSDGSCRVAGSAKAGARRKNILHRQLLCSTATRRLTNSRHNDVLIKVVINCPGVSDNAGKINLTLNV